MSSNLALIIHNVIFGSLFFLSVSSGFYYRTKSEKNKVFFCYVVAFIAIAIFFGMRPR
ncbi:MAG TPA: hypothetical protein VJH70_01440 [Candidatus Paceibacterota bacterium]